MYYDGNNDDRDIASIVKTINEYYIRDKFCGKYHSKNFNSVYRNEFTMSLLNGVIASVEHLDSLIASFLHKPFTINTLDSIVLQTLRLATFEFENYPNTDANVIVSEYVDIVSEFYGGTYTSITNGILDKIGKYLKGDTVANDKLST
jgi:transcription termination factor NusB